MDLSVRTETFNVGDHRWLGSDHGVGDGDPVTLDISTFTEDDHDANGFIPSGTVLGKITASGLYGPYDADAVNGLETAAGHLLTDVIVDITDARDVVGAIFRHGKVVESFLPDFTTTDGEIDAAAKTDLLGQIIYV